MSSEQGDRPEDDGFQSDNERDLEQKSLEDDLYHLDLRKNEDTKNWGVDMMLPPGQSIIGENRKYSLLPDMATGWMPKDSKSHPIPITVTSPVLDLLYEMLEKKSKCALNLQSTEPSKSFQMIICYFGPRYDNTYYAWYQMPFEFPYTNIQPPTDMKFNNRPFNGQNPTLHLIQPKTLVFDSFFEQANLDFVVKVGQYEYDLYLRVDSNTRGHFQWFNFKVKNLTKRVKYTFNICNLQKDESLYSRGMKPYVFSTKANEKMGREWQQEGENIKYDKRMSKSLAFLHSNHFHNHNTAKYQLSGFFRLSFQYQTQFEQDNIQISYCVPYTYTRLRRYLDELKKKCEKKQFYKQTRLCLSLGGLPVPQINIIDQSPRQQSEKTKKKCIVIGCRVHPGQSNSSFMLEGLLDFLSSNKVAARALRSKLQFYIVPMLNPDGVCFGNYRTGLSGKDFNRQYVNPDARIFPEVYSFKKLVANNKKKFGNNFMMFLDLHGHSVRKSVFMYGPENSIMDRFYYESRIFPRLLSKRTEMFRYYSCVFKIEQSKKTTARNIFQQILNIPLSFTIEASNGSYYDHTLLKDIPFNTQLWIQMGNQIGTSLYQYLNLTIQAEKARQQKYDKLNKFHVAAKEDINLRAIKLIERKKQKRKGGEKIQDFNYGRVNGSINEEYDEDLFKYIYEEIEQNELKKKINNDLNADEIYQEDEKKLKEGHSDSEEPQDDLEPEKLAFLYQVIKRKEYGQINLEQQFEKQQGLVTARSQKQENIRFKNQLIQSRVKSSFQQHEKNWKRLSQPKKTNHAIVNLTFFPDSQLSDAEPLQMISRSANKFKQSSKKMPKTFQDFVTSFQKWQKNQHKSNLSGLNPIKTHTTIQTSRINSGRSNRSHYSAQSNNDSIVRQGSYKNGSKDQTIIIQKRQTAGSRAQNYQRPQMSSFASEKNRIYSPVRKKSGLIKID